MEGTFPARADAWPAVRAFVEQACGAAGLPRPTCLRLTLLVEELFTNTVRHGHGGDSEAEVRVTLAPAGGGVRAVYEDSAPPHDPFAGVVPLEVATVEERPVGGLGVHLVSGLASNVRYERVGDRNHVAFEVGGPAA